MQDIKQELLTAVNKGDLARLERLLKDHADIDVSDIDDQGNSLLDHAVFYPRHASHELIKIKKQMVRRLLCIPGINGNLKNKNNLTSLQLAAHTGCVETGKELLKAKNLDKENLQRAFALADKAGHQRMAHAIQCYNRMDEPPEQVLLDKDGTALIAAAKNLDLADSEFLERLKASNRMEFQQNGTTVNVIDLRIDSQRKYFRAKMLKRALVGALCPAATAATFIATLGGIYPDPILAAVLTAVIFPILYFPLAYFSYQSRMRLFGSVTAETMYLGWQSANLGGVKKQFLSELENISERSRKIQCQINNVTSQQEFLVLNESLQQIKSDYKKQTDEIAKILECTNDKKPKLIHKYLPKEKFNDIKNLSLHDAKPNIKWVTKSDRGHAFTSYAADVLCAADGGLAVMGSIATIIGKITGWAFLGTSLLSFLEGPIGIPAVITMAAVLLTAGFAAMLYKSTYKQETAEAGARNRELICAYDDCKRNFDFTDLVKKKKEIEQGFKSMSDLTVMKEKQLQLDRADQQDLKDDANRKFLLTSQGGLFGSLSARVNEKSVTSETIAYQYK